MRAEQPALLAVVTRARDQGFLGPGDVDAHVAHSRGFGTVALRAVGTPPATYCDLGSGGGVPGLVLATTWRQAHTALLDARVRPCRFLRAAIETLGLALAEVLEGRAEEFARLPELREHFEVVTARACGAPAVTAELAAGLVALGGVLVVSEPPGGDPGRWDHQGVQRLGFESPRFARAGDVGGSGGATFAVLRKAEPVPERYPRRVGVPRKRPLW